MNELYWKNEQKCRRYTLVVGLYVVFHTLEFVIVVFYVVSRMWVGDYDTSTWHLSFKMSLPFDLTKPSGWWQAWFLEFNIAFSYSLCMTADTTYFVCVCLYVCTMCDHVGLLMQTTAKLIERHQTEKNVYKLHRYQLQAVQTITKAVQINVRLVE